jgi:hypothetical protein
MGVLEDMALLRTDAEKAKYCQQRAEELRDLYYTKQRDSVDYVLTSKSLQFRDYDQKARVLIGQRRWSESYKAKSILSDQQMFERWANMFNMSVLRRKMSE